MEDRARRGGRRRTGASARSHWRQGAIVDRDPGPGGHVAGRGVVYAVPLWRRLFRGACGLFEKEMAPPARAVLDRCSRPEQQVGLTAALKAFRSRRTCTMLPASNGPWGLQIRVER